MNQQLRTTLHGLTLVYAIVFAVTVLAYEAAAQQLLDQHQALEPRLRQNQFMRPVVLDSLALADKGLLGTSNYRIALEAVPLPDDQSFLPPTFSCSMGFLAGVATKTYLATIGRGKVGFTVVDAGAEGKSPHLIGGVRAVVERNTMRYYLAIESFLAAAGGAPAAQLDMRLQNWFSAVEM